MRTCRGAHCASGDFVKQNHIAIGDLMMISLRNPNIFVKILGGRPMVAPTMVYEKLLDKLKFAQKE